MLGTFTCLHFGKTMPRNPRLKKNKQSYCNVPKCKQAKKSARKKERYHTDPSYRQEHLDRQKLWRLNRPAHEYQKQYRESRPEYVEDNRELQAKRNCKRRKRASMIVNGTPFLAQMQIIIGEEAIFRQIGN